MTDFRFTLPLPWLTEIGGEDVEEVVCHFQTGSSRGYAPSMLVTEFENTGGGATPGFTVQLAIAIQSFSFSWEPALFLMGIYQRALEAVARFQVNKLVRNHTPLGYPDPVGITWPLSWETAGYLDGYGTVPPIPRGTFSALRLLPFSQYATTDVAAPLVRGGGPPH